MGFNLPPQLVTIISLIMALLHHQGVLAQPLVGEEEEPRREISVALVTIGVGPLPWERFGHNGIWIQDPQKEINHIYDFGRFDFDQKNFIRNYIKGLPHYWMGSTEASLVLGFYRRMNRSIWIQELNLNRAQKESIRDFLFLNDTDENRYYPYHYYLDNCSTRIRDVINDTIDNRLRLATENIRNGTSFRFHTQRLIRADLPLYTGVLAALGNPVDRPISAWEEMFLPMKVRDTIRNVTLADENGHDVPLVKSERTFFENKEMKPDETPPRWLAGFFFFGIALAGILWLTGTKAGASLRYRAGFSILSFLWTFLVGVSGMILTFLWAFTGHEMAYFNENLFILNPIALPLLILAPLSVFNIRWAVRPAFWLGIAVAALSLLGLMIQILPGFDQVNGQLMALFLPPNLAIGYVLWRRYQV